MNVKWFYDQHVQLIALRTLQLSSLKAHTRGSVESEELLFTVYSRIIIPHFVCFDFVWPLPLHLIISLNLCVLVYFQTRFTDTPSTMTSSTVPCLNVRQVQTSRTHVQAQRPRTRSQCASIAHGCVMRTLTVQRVRMRTRVRGDRVIKHGKVRLPWLQKYQELAL